MENRVPPGHQSNRIPAFEILLYAAWFGLITGLGEVLLLGIKKIILDRLLFLSQDFVWMVPIAYLSIFLFVGFIVAVATRARPQFISLRLLTSLFAFLCFFSIFLNYFPIHWLARLLLSLGLAYQAGRFIPSKSKVFTRIVRSSTPFLGSAVVLIYIVERYFLAR